MKQNFNIDQGASFQTSIIWKSSNGTPVNLTGWNAKMQLRTSVESPDVEIELSTFNLRITLSVEGGIAFYISAEDTSLIPKGIYVYDLLMISPSGDKTRLIEGTITVTQGVTRG